MRYLDAITEGLRERELMQAVRSGAADWRAHVPPFPLKLQVQTASPCNAACVMCPWPETAGAQPQGFMPEAVYAKLLAELTALPAEQRPERVGLFLMNEPLIDKRLPDWTARMRAALPEARLVIYTNGALLDGARAEALAAAGLDEISVSVVGFDRESHARNMPGVRWDTLLANLKEVTSLHADGSLGALEVRVVGLDFPDARGSQAEFERRVGLPVHLKTLTSRAGAVDVQDLVDAEDLDAAGFRACQRPFVKAYLLYDGRVVLCNCDWRRTTIVGDLTRNDLAEIWRGPALEAVRAFQAAKRPPAGSLCAGCDYPHLR